MTGYINWFIAGAVARTQHLMTLSPGGDFMRITTAQHDGIASFAAYATYFIPVHEFMQTLFLLLSALLAWTVFNYVRQLIQVLGWF